MSSSDKNAFVKLILGIPYNIYSNNMERDINFKETLTKLSKELPKVKYNNGDISDIGNEVGFQLGSILKDMTEEEIRDFISGFRHGVSLTNGTH